jgi:hypothetical protein
MTPRPSIAFAIAKGAEATIVMVMMVTMVNRFFCLWFCKSKGNLDLFYLIKALVSLAKCSCLFGYQMLAKGSVALFLSLSSASITPRPSIAFAIAKGAEATIVMVMMVEKDG